MNTEELNRLLEKYYKGESTEKEEGELRTLFTGDNVPEGYEVEKELFKYYVEYAHIPEPASDFESRIIEGIDETERNARSARLRRYILPYLSTAAGILLLVGSWYLIGHRGEPKDTFTDPRLAYTETMRILKDVSLQLNQGAKALEPVTMINGVRTKSFKTMNKTTTIIERNFKTLNYLQKAVEITNVPVEKSINK
jgi:hypothetical protein